MSSLTEKADPFASGARPVLAIMRTQLHLCSLICLLLDLATATIVFL